MKKIFTIVALAAALCACNKPVPQLNSNNYGYIDLGISADESMGTKAEQTVSSEDLSNWTVMVGSTKYTGPTQAFEANDYTITASNYETEAKALEANGNWGDAFYSGSQNVTVAKGATTNATIACGTAKNARLKVVFHESFTNIAKDYKLTATQNSRELEFNSITSGKVAYYAAGTAVNYVIKYKMKSNDSEEKTIDNKSFTLTAGQEKTITLKGNTNGTITISISYDDTFDTVGTGEEITIDAATGEEAK